MNQVVALKKESPPMSDIENDHIARAPQVIADERDVFTPEEVVRLNDYQRAGVFHPFTCGSGNRADARHGDGEGVLIATTRGWICPFCDYTQNWAHDFMKAYDRAESPFKEVDAAMHKALKDKKDA